MNPVAFFNHSEISTCNLQQFELVKQYIKELELDNRELSAEQFLVVSEGDAILGFGRKRKFSGFAELCSLGVMEEHRLKGIGSKIVKALTEKTIDPLYLVCVIPDFFAKLGFSICKTFPPEIQEKLDYCTKHLHVPENYIVMKKN